MKKTGMNKKLGILIAAQALFTCIQVYLISKISLIGKIGISLAYKEYKFLRSPVKTFAILFAVQVLVIFILWFINRKYPRRTGMIACGVVIAAALLGFLLTYNDFVHTYSHRLLKERFHLGFYLFWIGWIASAIFFLVTPVPARTSDLPQTEPGERLTDVVR